jgi:DNA-binding response OmpR family regulator
MNSPSDARPLVLLVEDDHDSREMYALALEMSSFRTVEAATASEARALAKERRPDVAVTDLTLPDADGADLCAELTANGEGGGIPTIVLTGRSSDEDVARCTAAGCARVLVKPCSPEALAAAISAVLTGTTRD